MKFTLKGEVTFSKDATEAEEDIKKFIDEANNEIFLKGVPEEQKQDASQIVNWNLKGEILEIEMKSGRRGRAHDALLRIKKPLTQLLGKKYRLGIRKILVNDYKIEIPTDEKVELKDVPYVDSYEVKDDEVILEFKGLEESDLRKHIIDRVIKHVTSALATHIPEAECGPSDILTKQVNKVEAGTILQKSCMQKYFFEGDPTEEAAKLGWVKKFSGRGQWFYAPPLVALQRALEDIFIEKLIEKLDFDECLFPKLIPLPVMERMKYLEGLPEGMYYCSAPRRDPITFDKFRDELVIKREVPIDLLKEGLKDPSYVLAPAQCEPFYEFLSHQVVDEKDLPIKFFDRSGWTYRWEAGGAKGLDRVHEFQRIELVWLGTPEQTEKIRDQTIDISHDIATEMELDWYTEVGDDPFYLEGRKVEKRGIEFPDIPKKEMRLNVPGQEKGVAVVSANIHGTHFVEGFSVKETH
ncbi:MAG TPA: serine--tRNA ligase, partial [Methanobacterium sp.]|nr:serine--tRNA ligase [Methanobacterium sp.]